MSPGAEAGREQRARRAPEILALALGLEDRPGRHQEAATPCPGAVTLKPPNGGCSSCARRQIGFAQHRQLGERRARGHRDRIDARKLLRPSGRAQRERDEIGQPAEQVALARSRVAGFELVVVGLHRDRFCYSREMIYWLC